MSHEARNLLIKMLLFLFVLFFVVGLIGHLASKLDWPSTWLLVGAFAFGSTLLTVFSVLDDRKTRACEITIAARLAPFPVEMHKCKDGSYAVIGDGPFSDFVAVEDLDLNELEAWTQGLQAGVSLMEARQYNEELEERIAMQETQFIEDRAHTGIGGEYIIAHIPGLEELGLLWGRMYKP